MDKDRQTDAPDTRTNGTDGATGPDASACRTDDDEPILDIDLEDLPEEPASPPQPEETLVITLDDLADIPDEPPASAAPATPGMYPGVDAKMLEAEKRGGEIDMYCLCSDTGQPFVVYWYEAQPGIYAISRIDKVAAERAGGGSGVSAIAGTFSLDGFEGCPHCGCRGLSVCEACGTTNCEGATQTTIFPPMRTLRCPNCGNRGNLQGQAPAAYGSRGGKGKKWSK